MADVTKSQLKGLVKANQKRPCSLEGCSKPRAAMSRYCTEHLTRYRWFNNPRGTALRPEDYAQAREAVEAVFEVRSEHPAIQAGIEWADGWLTSATLDETPDGWKVECPARRWLLHLYDAEVTGRDMLVELAAAYTWAADTNSHMDEPDQLLYTLAHRLLTMRGNIKTRGGNAHRYKGVGKTELMEAVENVRPVVPLLANLRQAVHSLYEARRTRTALLSKPVRVTVDDLNHHTMNPTRPPGEEVLSKES